MAQTTTIDLSVGAVLQRDPATLRPDTSIAAAARALIAAGASASPVVAPDGSLAGVVSEHDLLSKRGRTIAEIMSRGVIAVDLSASAAEAANLMALHGIRLLPVLQDGRLVGTVARSDLLELFAATHWTCQSCGATEHGLVQPESCLSCSGSSFSVERAAQSSDTA